MTVDQSQDDDPVGVIVEAIAHILAEQHYAARRQSEPTKVEAESEPFDRVWQWRTTLPERKGQRCRILARGTMNSCQIDFEDGTRHIVSRFAVRKTG